MIRSVYKTPERATKSVPRYCLECGKATREGKPFCVKHHARNPYVKDVLSQLDRAQREVRRVREWNRLSPVCGRNAVKSDGLVAREILSALRVHGTRSIGDLSKAMQATFDCECAILHVYAQALHARKLLHYSGEARGICFHIGGDA